MPVASLNRLKGVSNCHKHHEETDGVYILQRCPGRCHSCKEASMYVHRGSCWNRQQGHPRHAHSTAEAALRVTAGL